MRILIDADSCTQLKNAEEIAEHFKIQCIGVFNFANDIRLTYAEPVLVPIRPGSADDKIYGMVASGDIVVTADRELTQRCIEKGAVVFHTVGMVYPERVMNTLMGVSYDNFFKEPANAFTSNLKNLHHGHSPSQHQKRVFSARLIVFLRNLQNSANVEK